MRFLATLKPTRACFTYSPLPLTYHTFRVYTYNRILIIKIHFGGMMNYRNIEMENLEVVPYKTVIGNEGNYYTFVQ